MHLSLSSGRTSLRIRHIADPPWDWLSLRLQVDGSNWSIMAEGRLTRPDWKRLVQQVAQARSQYDRGHAHDEAFVHVLQDVTTWSAPEVDLPRRAPSGLTVEESRITLALENGVLAYHPMEWGRWITEMHALWSGPSDHAQDEVIRCP